MMKIRQMDEDDLPFTLDCIAREGWLSETEPVMRGFLQYDPQACFIGEEGGRRVGMCVGVPYGESAFFAELIVARDRRGHGFGRRLLEHCVEHLQGRGCRSIYLDGDRPAVGLYEKAGFRHLCRTLRFVGQVQGTRHTRVRQTTRDDMGRIGSIDREAFGADRRFFLEQRLRLSPRLCRTAIVDHEIVGFGFCMPGNGVISVGPLAAIDRCERPVDLLEAIAAEAEGAKLRVSVLESNSAALRMMREVPGLNETEPSWRMVRGADSGLGSSANLFAIGSSATG